MRVFRALWLVILTAASVQGFFVAQSSRTKRSSSLLVASPETTSSSQEEGIAITSNSLTTPINSINNNHQRGERIAQVVFVTGTAPSGYGTTSPQPNPTWDAVAAQLAHRLPHFAGTAAAAAADEEDSQQDLICARVASAATTTMTTATTTANTNLDLSGANVVVALGVVTPDEQARFAAAVQRADPSMVALLTDPTCGDETRALEKAGDYQVAHAAWQSIVARILPWSSIASGRRLLQKTSTLLQRKSSEDYIFAILFCIHALIRPIDVVKSDINPSWEKGVVRNVQELARMCDKCGPQIAAALTDPQTKQAIDLLNACDLRDQVGSYRVIVSNETPQLEDFTLCILQQNDCFNCDAPILTRPAVPLLETWQDQPLDDRAARQILMGHLKHEAASPCAAGHDWSWKIVVGANPAYDAFPMQHQIFYPSGSSKNGKALWYDPVFCVETLQGDLVWCKRHYKCTPRRHRSGRTAGAWTLTTLDNGMVSVEHWTTVDAADDLSWCVLHYSGAARRAGQSYVGALLCTPDGKWPESCKSGDGLERIRSAFRNCDLELWELFGGSTERSYMWSDKFTNWARDNPPPLDRIGDISITKWRKAQRGEMLAQQARS